MVGEVHTTTFTSASSSTSTPKLRNATVLLRLCRQIRRTTRCFSTARWTHTRHTLHWLVKVSMDSSEQIVAHTTSDTDHSGFRPNVVDEHEDDYVCARIAGRPWTVTESCLFRTQGLSTSETPGSIQGRMVRRRIRRFVQQDLLLFWCHRQV